MLGNNMKTLLLKQLLLLVSLITLASCATVISNPDSLSLKPLTCNKLIADKIGIIRLVDDDEKAEEQKAFVKNTAPTAFEERMLNTHCFKEVKLLDDEGQLKDFDRNIKIKVNIIEKSNFETAKRALWIVASASTLFLLPYFGTENYELRLEDSKTGFKKFYNFKADHTMHMIFFFAPWDLKTGSNISNEKLADFMNDFLIELKAKL